MKKQWEQQKEKEMQNVSPLVQQLKRCPDHIYSRCFNSWLAGYLFKLFISFVSQYPKISLGVKMDFRIMYIHI